MVMSDARLMVAWIGAIVVVGARVVVVVAVVAAETQVQPVLVLELGLMLHPVEHARGGRAGEHNGQRDA